MSCFARKELSKILHSIFTDYLPQIFAAGFKYTITLALISFILGLIIALVTALVRISDKGGGFLIIKAIFRFYVWLFRSTPLLVQLFIVYFGLPYVTNVLYLYVAHPANRMGVLPYRDILGETSPFYCTGIGKAILAHMPEEEWLAHIPAERTRFQPNTITDLDAIVEELRRTRRRGYAIDNSERDPNVRCVGVPVYNSAGKLVAGVSTSGPAITMTDEKLMECAGILQNAALRMRERIYR